MSIRVVTVEGWIKEKREWIAYEESAGKILHSCCHCFCNCDYIEKPAIQVYPTAMQKLFCVAVLLCKFLVGNYSLDYDKL